MAQLNRERSRWVLVLLALPGALIIVFAARGSVATPPPEAQGAVVSALPSEAASQGPTAAAAKPSATRTPCVTLPSTLTATPKPTATATAAPAPQVVAAFPIHGDEGVPIDQPVRIVFDLPMDRDSVTASFSVEPPIEGSGEWIDPTQFVFRPTAWAQDTEYTVRVSDAVSEAGGALSAVWETAFSTKPGGKVPLPILMYHRVKELPSDASVGVREWTTAPADFAAHLSYLEEQGFHPVPLWQIVAYLEEGAPLPSQPLAITFDDGYCDFYDVAWPLLREHKYSATMFIIPSHTAYRAFLTWEQISELSAAGVDFGSHTLDHVSLKGLEPAELSRQLAQSRSELDSRLSLSFMVLSYPFGGYDANVLQEAQAAGYDAAVTINPSRYQYRGRIHQLNRVHLPYGASIEDFARLLGR